MNCQLKSHVSMEFLNKSFVYIVIVLHSICNSSITFVTRISIFIDLQKSGFFI